MYNACSFVQMPDQAAERDSEVIKMKAPVQFPLSISDQTFSQ